MRVTSETDLSRGVIMGLVAGLLGIRAAGLAESDEERLLEYLVRGLSVCIAAHKSEWGEDLTDLPAAMIERASDFMAKGEV